MGLGLKKDRIILLAGDIACFILALLGTLLIRNRGELSLVEFIDHLSPFVILFLVWVGVFFIFDLYRPQTTLFKQRLPAVILRAQVINSILAISFFYFIPYFGITPKTVLFIDLVISFGLIWAWRRGLAPRLAFRRRQPIFFACSGVEVDELQKEISHNRSYHLRVLDQPPAHHVADTVIVFNPYDHSPTAKAELYPLLLSGAMFVSVFDLYEEIFLRVPLSLITEEWCLQNISAHPKPLYDFFKRIMDIILSLILLVITVPFYVLVWVVNIFGRSQIFSVQTRVGRNNKPVVLYKFRTMTIANDDGQWGANENKVTKFGAFLRKTRIDELPQVFSVFRGDLSLIGPRPEFAKAIEEYAATIPFYNLRHVIKPGLSGWAQMYHDLHPHHGLDITETSHKLSYDLHYIKNRSLLLDLGIALKTVKTLLSIAGK